MIAEAAPAPWAAADELQALGLALGPGDSVADTWAPGRNEPAAAGPSVAPTWLPGSGTAWLGQFCVVCGLAGCTCGAALGVATRGCATPHCFDYLRAELMRTVGAQQPACELPSSLAPSVACPLCRGSCTHVVAVCPVTRRPARRACIDCNTQWAADAAYVSLATGSMSRRVPISTLREPRRLARLGASRTVCTLGRALAARATTWCGITAVQEPAAVRSTGFGAAQLPYFAPVQLFSHGGTSSGSARHDEELGLMRGDSVLLGWCCEEFCGPGAPGSDWSAWPPDAPFHAGGAGHLVGAGVPAWLPAAAVAGTPLSVEAMRYAGELGRMGKISGALLTILCDQSNPELALAESAAPAKLRAWDSWARQLSAAAAAAPAPYEYVCAAAPRLDPHERVAYVQLGERTTRGGVVLMPIGADASPWLAQQPPTSVWVDGSTLVPEPARGTDSARARKRYAAQLAEAAAAQARLGRSVLLALDEPRALHQLEREGLIVGSWLPDSPDYAARRLAGAAHLPGTVRGGLHRWASQVRALAAYGPALCRGDVPQLPPAGVRRASSDAAGPARVVAALLADEAVYFTKKALAPGFIDATPGPPPPQACICPLNVAVEAIVEAGADMEDVLAALLRLVGQPYDYACAHLLYDFGVARDDGIPEIAALLSLPMEQLHPLAKELSGLVKRWGAPPDWGVPAARVAEIHCIGARGIGAADVRDEIAHRKDLGHALPISSDRVADVIRRKLDDDLRPARHRLPTPCEFMELRALWVTSGSQPSGAAVLPEGAVVIDGATKELKFRHTKKSWVETIGSQYLDDVLQASPQIRATYSVKINDPAKVRVLYGCDTESYLAYSYVLAPIEAALARSDMLLRPGAADELVAVLARTRELAQGVGYMYDFDDFNSQHSYEAMKGVFMGVAASAWCQGQPEYFRRAVAWCVHALDRVVAKYPNGAEVAGPLGLMSGWRATSFVNTLLNWAYLTLAAEEAQVPEALAFSQHAGDDVFAVMGSRVDVLSLMCSLKALGARGNELKIAISRQFGEFLRCRYELGSVSGYVARPIASLATGNFMGRASLDPLQKASEVAEHVARCVTRGLRTRLGSCLLVRLARYWGAVRHPETGAWHAPPDAVLYAPRSRNGLGIVGDGALAARWWRTSLPQPPDLHGEVLLSSEVPSLATDDAVVRLRDALRELPLGNDAWARARNALLASSYSGSAIAAAQAATGHYAADHLIEWYAACRQIPVPSAQTGLQELRHAASHSESVGGPVELLTGALGHVAPTAPRLYGLLAKVAGLRDAVRGTPLARSAATHVLVQAVRPQDVAEYQRLVAEIGHARASAFVWAATDTDFVAVFHLSGMVRDYAWLLHHIAVIASLRLATSPPLQESLYARGVVALAGWHVPGLGAVTA